MPYEGFVNCIRCNKQIDHPDSSNADYIMAEDTIVEGTQKTGVVCPDCYKETDFVIWGVHKDVLVK